MKITNKILTDFLAGDMQAYQKIYEETKSFVYNVVYKMVLNKPEAEDLMHDVYVKIYEKRAMYKKDYSINTWINRVAVNHVLNHIKRKKNFLVKMQDISFFYKQQASEENKSEDIALKLLAKVGINHRLPIVLKDIHEMSYEDIAKIMRLPIGTIRSRLNRGRKRLRKLYEKEVCSDKKL
jgi:RNA polymerase sigma-70 factor, ECF subfamily